VWAKWPIPITGLFVVCLQSMAMVQTLQANDIDLRTLIDTFRLRRVCDRQFFWEWQEGLPELTEFDRQFLDRIKEGYLNLVEYPPLLERAIQLSIVSPLLFLAGFYLPPFHIQTEKSIEIAEDDDGILIRGQIDILLVKEQFWVMVIESKRAAFSMDAGLAQLLAYMLANPHTHKPGFGMVATGGTFTFVKLVQGDSPQFSTSDQFGILNQVNGLHDVFRILNHIGHF
jgi:hypothetical protein